jgi:transketolase
LAQTLSQAAGVAFARRLKGEVGSVWVFMSDGEFQEGQTWEAFAAAHHHRLGNMTVVVDCNGQQCDGPMDSVMNVEPLADRLRAFGAEVREVDGNSVTAVATAAEAPHRDRPLVVLGRTDPCCGLDILRSRAPKLHYVRFSGPAERDRYRAVLDEWEQR